MHISERSTIASIIIPAYNAEDYIIETLHSISCQEIENIEIIIIDDGSSDRTYELVKNYPDSRVRTFKISNSGGPSKPRNLGLQKSEGKYIFLFDSDDLMLNGKIQHSINQLESHPEADFLFSDFNAINEYGEVIVERYLSKYESFHSLPNKKIKNDASLIQSKDLLYGLSVSNFIGTSSVVLRKEAIKPEYLFNERLKNGDDFDFWVHLAIRHSAIFVDKPLHQYRIHSNSISKSDPTKRLKNLFIMHYQHSQEEIFPPYFRSTSRSKAYRYSITIAKSALKDGHQKEARKFLKHALTLSDHRVKPNGLLFLTYIPSFILYSILTLRKKIPKRR